MLARDFDFTCITFQSAESLASPYPSKWTIPTRKQELSMSEGGIFARSSVIREGVASRFREHMRVHKRKIGEISTF